MLITVIYDRCTKKEVRLLYPDSEILEVVFRDNKVPAVMGYVAGCTIERGISIVEPNTGVNMLCLVPNLYNYSRLYDVLSNYIKNGYYSVFDMEDIYTSDGIKAKGDMLPCPYK